MWRHPNRSPLDARCTISPDAIGPRVRVAPLWALAVAGFLTLAAPGLTAQSVIQPAAPELVDTRGIPAPAVSLGGVLALPETELANLFPQTVGIAAIYNDGKLVRVYDALAGVGPVELVLARQGDLVVMRDRRVHRMLSNVLMLERVNDPSTGEELQLDSDHRSIVRMLGDAGHLESVPEGRLLYCGQEDITIGSETLRAARYVSWRGASDTPPRDERVRAVWYECATGLPLLEASSQGAGNWRAVWVRTGTATVPERLLERTEILAHVRSDVLGLGAQTLTEPTDPEQVPAVADAEIDPRRVPTTPATVPVSVAVRQVVVGFGRPPERSREAAQARANQLVRLARRRGVDFAEVARYYSDDQSSHQGGYAGIHQSRGLSASPPCVQAAFQMEVDQVSEPIAEGSTFVIVSRGELIELAAARIVIGHAEALRSLPGQPVRTRAEALALARDVVARARKGEDFAGLAAAYSEAPDGVHGGELGVVAPGQLDPVAMAALSALEIGETADAVECTHGLMILQRRPILRVRASVLTIGWVGCRGAAARTTLTKEEAAARALEIRERLLSPGVDAMQLILDEGGADAGLLDVGRIPVDLQGLRGLGQGQVLGPVDTLRGFVLAVRTE